MSIEVERQDAVSIIHLDDGKANALTVAAIAAIVDAVRAAEDDAELGAVVVHGRPGRFSGGFDLEVMRSGDIAAMMGLVSDGGDLVRTMWGSGVPVVAACTGHAVAAGALMLLGCDVRVGADIEAKIGLNEVAISMVLPGWALTIAGDRLSKRHFHRAVANARLTTPRQAVDVGFLDEVVDADTVLDRAIEIAGELAATLDPAAYARTVALTRGGTLDRMAEQIAADRAIS